MKKLLIMAMIENKILELENEDVLSDHNVTMSQFNSKKQINIKANLLR